MEYVKYMNNKMNTSVCTTQLRKRILVVLLNLCAPSIHISLPSTNSLQMYISLKNLVFHVFELYINGMKLFVRYYTIHHYVGESSMLYVIILHSFSVLYSVPVYDYTTIVCFPVDEL